MGCDPRGKSRQAAPICMRLFARTDKRTAAYRCGSHTTCVEIATPFPPSRLQRCPPRSSHAAVMIKRSELTEYIAFAHELADQAGAAILPYFRRRIRVQNKASSGFDPVTAADRAAERVISKALASRWPDHGLEGEEYGLRNEDARLRWSWTRSTAPALLSPACRCGGR